MKMNKCFEELALSKNGLSHEHQVKEQSIISLTMDKYLEKAD